MNHKMITLIWWTSW